MKAAAANWLANNDGKDQALTAESCAPANGYIDPGETNTVSFVIKNNSGGDRTEVKVSLLEQGNVTFPSGEVNVGNVAKDATFTVSFTFRAAGSCAGLLTPTLRVTAKDVAAETISYVPWQLGETVKTSYGNVNGTSITINDWNSDSAKLGRASPYPATIAISGMPKADTGETVDKVSVTLTGVSHGWSQDIQVLLVGPNGKSVVLMANAGGATDLTAPISNVNLTFEDSASGQIPQNAGQITSGTYKPSNYGAGSFPDAGAATDSSLGAAFNGMSDPNGTWKLYVIDDSLGASGNIAGGWSLSIRTTKIVCCGAGQTWPFVSRIGEATVAEDLGGAENVQIAAFSVADLDNADSSGLAVSATSGDAQKVTNDNLVVEAPNGAANPARVLKVKKLVANANGNVTITVVVTDQQGHTSTSSFNLKITPVNDAPTISSILGQRVPQGTATGPISFTVGDVETLPENLLVIPSTSDPSVVPVQNILLAGTGANRTVNVQPASSTTTNTVTITLTVRDAGDGTNPPQETPRSFVVSFGAQPGYPTITPIANTSVKEDGSISIPFNVRSGNPAVSPDSLVITKSSSNTGILPTAGIVITGSGIDRTVTLTPAANANGTVAVTLTVANGSLTDTTTFNLVVLPVNDAPTITAVGAQTTNEDTTSGDIVFTVGDVETPAADLVVTASSGTPGLVPNVVNPPDFATAGGIQITASGATRTVRVRPAPNQFGKVTIVVTVTDAGDPSGNYPNTDDAKPKATQTAFVLTVNAVNDPPTIAAVGNDSSSLVPWGATDPVISFPEDSGSTADATKGQRTIVLSGITPGDATESNQSVTVAAASNKPDVISIVKVDPATVSGATANTTLTVKLGENKWTPADGLVEITLTLTDNGGTDLGGNNTSVRKFKINVTPVNDAPSLAFPTLPAPLPGQTLSELNVPKNRSFTLSMSVSDVETPRTLMIMSASVTGDANRIFTDSQGSSAANILFDAGRTIVTFLPNALGATPLPYTVTVDVTAKDLGATNSENDNSPDAVKPLSVTRTFKVTIRDIEPPTLTAASPTLTVNEDTVASTVLTVTDNKPVGNLTFSVKSDNEVLVPKDNILLGPLADPNALQSTRQLAIVPQPDQNGVANITITVKDDETLETQTVVKVTFNAVNDPPTITLRGIIAPTIDSQGVSHDASITILEDKVTADPNTDSKLLEFDVADAPNETPVGSLVITKASSNTDLVPVDNIVISGTGNRRTLTVTPAPNKNGATTITLTVTDETSLSASARFTLNVTPVNDAPTINAVSNMSLQENAAEQTVQLSGIGVGPDSGQSIISVSVSVKDKGSDPAVNTIMDITQQPGLPSDGKTSFKFKPRTYRSGTSTFTVSVQDDGGTANDGKDTTSISFDVVVAAVNQDPTFTFDLTTPTTTRDITLDPGANTGVISFYINDVETLPRDLVVTAVSSNPNLVPNTPTNLQLGGANTDRGILIQPAPGQAGSAVITITVRDADGGTKSGIINLTVRPGQNPTIVLTPTSQQISANQFSDLINIFVSDAQTPADQLKIGWQDSGLVVSDNPTLVPASASNIQFGGTGGSRAMIILPARDQTGTAHITLRVKDGDGNVGSAVFTLIVLGEPPTITTPTPSSVNVGLNSNSPAVTVTVNDKETFPGFLEVTGKSSDQSIIPDANIIVLGAGTSRSATVIAGNKPGTVTITLTCKDAEGQTATTSFVVNVIDTNTPPTITSIGPQTTTTDTPVGPLYFVVGDAETPAASLVVTAESANTVLVPNTSANLQLGITTGNPASRYLAVTPASGQTGVALITVTVTDAGNKKASTSFSLTVSAAVSVANDFNGDRAQDIILQDAKGFVGAWFMSGDDLLQSSFLTPFNVGDVRWQIVGAGDFNSDGKPDLLFQHTDGSLAVWLMNGVTMTEARLLTPSNAGHPDWKAVAVGDFNRDGKPDILFQNDDQSLALWFMDGTTMASTTALRPSKAAAGWKVIGVGDLNKDNKPDIIFQHDDSSLAAWYMLDASNLNLAAPLNPSKPGDINWRAVGTIDLNGDGKTDLLFQNRSTGDIAVWYMDGPTLLLGKTLNPMNPGGTWKVVAP